jgi:N-acyl-D-aspartate/D-glutamate deacylase
MLDIAIRGGEVIDGTGAARQRADVGIAGGRIAAVGQVGDAQTELDASGLVVAPGFVDVHTHVDAQVFWDRALTPYSLHGVTTMFAGNCGFTLAPLSDDTGDYLLRMLAVVEGMPLESLQAGVPCDWHTTAEYLDRIDGTTAINVAFMVGHSALRRLVMGDDAARRAAEPHEVEAMARLLADGLEAGGIGFSSSWGITHFDADGAPVPSRWASVDELLALAAECRSFPGTSLEFIPPGVNVFTGEELELLSGMSTAAGRPLNWNVLRMDTRNRDFAAGMLGAADYAATRGGKVVALNMPVPLRSRFTFRTGFALDSLPDWPPVFALPPDERLVALRDPAWRARLEDGARRAPGQLAGNLADWATRVICEVADPALRRYEGRIVGEVAVEEGKTPFDALLDIVCADGLQTTFTRLSSEPTGSEWRAMVDAWRSGRAVIGASDAGAHLDFSANFDYHVYVLAHAVREHGALGLEEAVHHLTEVPASLYGLRGRGTVTAGNHADLVLFDEAAVGPGPIHTRRDLPAGAGRLYAEPTGIARVMVSGTTVAVDGKVTGEQPGRVLRSGLDTGTPSMSLRGAATPA